MGEHELEEVMNRFIRHEIDVLVCTTIIESGVDIPNANTILVNRADTFGLAQLYQLRGRVGRSHHRAYAYLVAPDKRSMTADARNNLARHGRHPAAHQLERLTLFVERLERQR